MLDIEDPDTLKSEIKRLELELKKTSRQLSVAQAQIERFGSVNVMQHEAVGTLKIEMSRQEKFMTMLLKYSKNTILLLDRELNIAYYTDNFFRETVKGKKQSIIEGKSVFDVHEQYFGDAAALKIKRVVERAIQSKETQIIKEKIRYSASEQPLIYYVYVTAMFDGEDELDGAILLYTNITELENSRVKAEAASRAKSEFLAKMSHEIRTPMNTIIGMSDLMPQGNLSSRQKNYLADIKKMSKILLDTINEILDFSKAESGKLELTPTHFSVSALFSHIRSMQSFIAAQKAIAFQSYCSPSIPEFIYADETRVSQIFTNLINNAIKYTRKGSVSFTLDTSMVPGKDGEYLVATVADTGIGIKKENIPLLFESFQQMDTRKNKGIEGTGLGLAIVKQLVTLMGGFIEVASEYEKGSVFTVVLPLVAGDPSQADKPLENTRQFIAREGAMALVVDDVPANLTVASGFLDRCHIGVDTAEDGQAAVKLVERSFNENRPYDIIFMDHMMPHMDGIETTRRIRELEESRRNAGGKFPDIPVICLSANAVRGMEKIFLSSGMNGFIPKPIESAALNETLRQFLPEGTAAFAGPEDDGAAVGNLNQREEIILGELANIEELDADQGLHYAADSFKTYASTLKQFSAGLTKSIAIIRESLVEKDWNSYTVQAHAFKGICATIGAKALSEWGKLLEAASKSEDKSPCFMETDAFCSALETFNDALRRTSLFAKTDETDRVAIGAADMAAKLAEFAEACEEGRAARIRAALKALEGLSLAAGGSAAQSGFETVFTEALDLARSLDYDEAAEKARGMLVQLHA
jgi:signal transduction histidine kinase/CheY-like chemotaxis protein/HPt (histidine-containing phosphotransfer) domain-containing protein